MWVEVNLFSHFCTRTFFAKQPKKNQEPVFSTRSVHTIPPHPTAISHHNTHNYVILPPFMQIKKHKLLVLYRKSSKYPTTIFESDEIGDGFPYIRMA